MAGSGKSSSIVSALSTLLLKAWQKWDVRGMILFSLTLQIVLSVFGRWRKYTINPFFKIILWFAYLSADWIAIATLGKLSGSNTESPTTNILRTYWAPLLLLHLGGPDTITAYSFEDNKFWIRHLLILVVKAIFVVYLICLSWTFSWPSFLSFPLILAGMIKYIEKILCLQQNNSQKTKSVISNAFSSSPSQHFWNQSLDQLLKKNPNVLLGYLFFTIMRPDVNDYLSSHNFLYTKMRITACVKETTGIDEAAVPFMKFNDMFVRSDSNLLKIFAVELEFIFDVIYTKVALIYTKLGCLLRLTSFASSFLVLLLFFISIINEPKFHFSRVDLVITGILLTGAITQEVYAAWIMLSSDWAILVAEFHHSVFVRKLFKAAIKCFSCLLHQSERWSNRIGQFDLLEYCWLYNEKKVNKFWRIVRNITDSSELWHKYRFTKFDPVPNYLQDIQNFFHPVSGFLMTESFHPSRGEKALERAGQNDDLGWSIQLDFDYSIIIWHLATSVCYYQEQLDQEHQGGDTSATISKKVSNYMMYLLAMCPTLILPDHSKSFWLDHAYDKLKGLLIFATNITDAVSKLVPENVHEEDLESCFSESTMENASNATDIRNAAPTLHSAPDNVHNTHPESGETTFADTLQKDVSDLARFLKKSEKKWELIRDVWIEMLAYAAVSSQHISHIKQLGEGIEFLSFIWLWVGLIIIFRSIDTR